MPPDPPSRRATRSLTGTPLSKILDPRLDLEDVLPYASIYTIPDVLPKGERELVKVDADNIREIRELGTGLFAKAIYSS